MSTPDVYRDLLQQSFKQSDAIFDLLPEGALHQRPIGLRHPFLFYVGHLPAFAWNQIGRGVLKAGHFAKDMDLLFARGIDPADQESAPTLDHWPALSEVLAYRDAVRQTLLDRVPDVLSIADDVLSENGRIFHLVAEHELMHHETLMYMMQEFPNEIASVSGDYTEGEGQAARPCAIPAGRVRLGVDFDQIDFGWDNEFGNQTVDIPAFILDSLPVRNRDYFDFLSRCSEAEQAFYWPKAWVQRSEGLYVKTIKGYVAFERAAGWPVQVSGLQARGYAQAHGGRLPTEAELHHAAFSQPDGTLRPFPWGNTFESHHGNLNFQQHHPVPTGHHPAGASAWGVEELVGNGWEWTSSPFAPLPGFQAFARTYPGYSADFFDNAHDIVFGGSWATHVKLLRPSFRNWYRRDYPYVFSSFRILRN